MTDPGPVRLPIRNPSGLHARPAALFVRTAGAYQSEIRLRNVTRGGDAVDAKSILAVLTLGISRGHEIEITAHGTDAGEALSGLRDLVTGGIGEPIDPGSG